jgi:hypothetical protein
MRLKDSNFEFDGPISLQIVYVVVSGTTYNIFNLQENRPDQFQDVVTAHANMRAFGYSQLSIRAC